MTRATVRLALAIAVAAATFAACVVVEDLGSTGDPQGSSTDAPVEGATTPGDETGSPGTDAGLDGASSSSSGGVGGGPYGALSAGYCCTSDEQCRFRHCLPSDAGRMCLDECGNVPDSFCKRPNFDFRCDRSRPDYEQTCQPTDDGFQCIPSSQFTVGTREAGACCSPRTDNLHGQECLSNLCISYKDGPYACTRVCEAGADCPKDWRCVEQLYDSWCVPPLTYTCTP